ncbi:MAG TPA: hypothetical protein VF519_08660 [Mycobacteriales bacterium]|jgi:hypothetical protein
MGDVPIWLNDDRHVGRLLAARASEPGPGLDGWATVALIAQTLDILLACGPTLNAELAAHVAGDTWAVVEALTPTLPSALPPSDPENLLRPWRQPARDHDPPFADLLGRCCASLCDALAEGCDAWSLAFALRDTAYALGAYAVVAARDTASLHPVEGAS